MIGRWLRRLAVSGVVGAAVWFVVKSLRGEPLPAYESGPAPATRPDPARPGVPTPEPESEPAPAAPPTEAAVEIEPAVEPEPIVEPPEASASGDGAWVEAVADQPGPASHPVKAKLKSGIYHLPGMLNYDRTVPDRWYTTAEAAEADQLRRAKR